MLVNLPDVVIKHLLSFLSYDDIHYFINSNKLHFSQLKQETIYFSLNKQKSREYVEDERFRIILNKVKDGSQQVGLRFDINFSFIAPDIRDIVAHKIHFGGSYPHFPKNVSSLVFTLPSEITKIPFLPALQKLTLYDCTNIKDFSSLSHLKELELYDVSALTDITPLQNIPHLSFSDCPNIQNFFILSSKKQKSLSLSQSKISDVSFLRNILTVKLSLCNHIIDVSPLHGIKNLYLYNCSGIKDISYLGNHHRLTIFYCSSIERGYECFRTVQHAGLKGFKVPDLTVFLKVKSLRISLSSSIDSQLFLLKDIPDLSVSAISIYQREVYDISHLRNSRLVIYEDFIKIGDSVPSQLRHLELIHSDQILKIMNEGKISTWQHLQSLYISNCSIEHANGLGDIPSVTIQACLKLRDISSLGRNRYVALRTCSEIREVSSLATVPIVTIENCDGVIDYICLSAVPRLKIVKRK